MMEANEQRNDSRQPLDFVEYISQDFHWDEIDRALGDKPDQLAPTNTCLPRVQEFNADDLSLFSSFANSLPSLGPQATDGTDVKAISSAVGHFAEEAAKTGTDLAQNSAADLHPDDFDFAEEMMLSSQMEDLMTDILDSSVTLPCGEKQTGGVGEQTTSNVNECAVDRENSNLMLHDDLVSDSLSAAEQSKTEDDVGCETLDFFKNKHQNFNDCNDVGDGGDDDDDDDLTDSQKWVLDQIETHLKYQHDEASRINSLRDLQPPDGSSVPRDPINLAIQSITTDLEALKLDFQLINHLCADNPNVSECSKLLDEYDLHKLSPSVLVRYPFFAGTVDVSCRWEGDEANELRTAAHRLRGFMMALYVRDSINEDFLTTLNKQVSLYRHALAANSADLTELMRKCRRLNGLSEFFNCLYSNWDKFLIKFCDRNHQIVDLNTEHQSTPRWMQRVSRRTESYSKYPDSARADDTRTQIRAAVSNPPIVSGVLELATNEDFVTTMPESSESATGECRANIEPASEMSAADDVNMTTSQWQSNRLRSATGARLLLDDDVKPVLQTVKQTSRHGCSEEMVKKSGSVHEDTKPITGGRPLRSSRNHSNLDHSSGNSYGYVESVTEDVKPVVGLPFKKRPVGRPLKGSRNLSHLSHSARDSSTAVGHCDQQQRKLRSEDITPVIGNVGSRRGRELQQSRRNLVSKMTDARNSAEVNEVTEWASLGEQDVKPDLSTLDVSEDVKPVIGTVEINRRGRKRKKRRLNTRSGKKKSVEVVGEIASTRFEKQEVKPDLSSLDRKIRRRSKQKWLLGSPGVVTRRKYRIMQLSASTSDAHPASRRVSPRHSPQSPPFTLLSPSQIKVEVES